MVEVRHANPVVALVPGLTAWGHLSNARVLIFFRFLPPLHPSLPFAVLPSRCSGQAGQAKEGKRRKTSLFTCWFFPVSLLV